jgi:hypothetical protein
MAEEERSAAVAAVAALLAFVRPGAEDVGTARAAEGR